MTDQTSIRANADSWSDDDITQLRELAGCSTTAHIIALNLGRSEDAVRSKAHELGRGVALDAAGGVSTPRCGPVRLTPRHPPGRGQS